MTYLPWVPLLAPLLGFGIVLALKPRERAVVLTYGAILCVIAGVVYASSLRDRLLVSIGILVVYGFLLAFLWGGAALWRSAPRIGNVHLRDLSKMGAIATWLLSIALSVAVLPFVALMLGCASDPGGACV